MQAKYIFILALCLVEVWIYHTFCWVHVGRQLVKELEQRPSILLCLIKKNHLELAVNTSAIGRGYLVPHCSSAKFCISSIITGWDPCGWKLGRRFTKWIWNGVRPWHLSKRSALEAADSLDFGTTDPTEGLQHRLWFNSLFTPLSTYHDNQEWSGLRM